MVMIRSWGIVFGWVLACFAVSPLAAVGFALSWLNWLAQKLARWVLWCFWVPSSVPWNRLVRAYRVARAKHTPEVENEIERVRKANGFARRARRVGRGR